MILGKITVQAEYVNRRKWLFTRPVSGGDNLIFPTEIGMTHVVYIEKNVLSENMVPGQEYTFYGIFDKIPSRVQWDYGYIDSKVFPITREIFEQLLELYPQNHFLCPISSMD